MEEVLSKINLFLFPLILILNPNNITKKHMTSILLVFSLSTFLITILTNVAILITGLPEKYILSNDLSFSYRSYFEDLSRLHPTYISIFLVLSALIFLDFFLKKGKYKYAYLTAFICCFLSLIPLAAKMPIIAFVIVFPIYLYKQPEIWKKSKYISLYYMHILK